MGGATALLSRGRALALAGLLCALVVYCAVASRLWTPPTDVDLALVAIVVLPAFFAAIWLALPLARATHPLALLGVAAIAAAAWGVLALVGVESVANVSKFAAFALLGLWFVSLFLELWWVALVAVLVPWIDVWSVATGPTRYVVEERPELFDGISVAFPAPGDTGSVNIGPPDVVFFGLFLAAADRFGLRVAWTWVGMTVCLGLTLALVRIWEVSGLPALPAVCLGFLVPNADLLWRNARDAWQTRKDVIAPGDNA